VTVKKTYRPVFAKKKHKSMSPPYRAKKHKGKKKILIGLGLTAMSLMSAVAGALLAVTFSESSLLQQAEFTPEEEAVFSQEETVDLKNLNIPELSRPVNILVLGIKVLTSDLKDRPIEEDLGYHALVNSFEGLSDTMLLLRFDPLQKRLSVLSIPRDTQVDLEGYGVRKINRANEYGGPAMTAATVSELMGGVTIDRYVRVNIQGVEKLIDALGGVTVDVPKDMKYNDFSQHLYIDLKKGKQHLDGDKAVQFLRFRYDAYGDISRVQRQQMLMRSVVEQAMKPATIVKIPKILSVIQSHLDTNLTVKELMALANFASQTKRSNVQLLMLPGDFSGNGRNEVSYWLPNDYQIQKIAQQHFDLPIADLSEQELQNYSRLKIAIQNNLEDSTAAEAILTSLREAGYERAYISNDTSDPIATTKIIAQSGDRDAANLLRATLGVGEVLVESTGVLNSDITIQVGEDWQTQI
jgi:LCP family protein required for cell wall assembly